MLGDVRKQLGSVKLLVTFLTIAVGIYLFQIAWQVLGIFSDVLIIIFSAWVLSVILVPLVEKLSYFTKVPKVASACIVYLLFFSLIALTIVLFIPALITQTQSFITILPKYVSSSPDFINKLTNTGLSYLENSFAIIPSVATFLFYTFLVLIISFYLVIDYDRFQKEFYNMLPKKWHEHVKFGEELIDNVFGDFLRVQILFGAIAGIATWIILRAFNVDFAATTAVVAGILTAIPTIGPVFGIVPPVLIAFLADPTKGLLVLLAILAMQQVLFNIVGPKLLGRVFKMHPIIVLLSFIVGYKIFGALGAIFAVPVLGILIVFLHRLSRHFLSENQK